MNANRRVFLKDALGAAGVAGMEYLGLDLWKYVIFRRLVCLLLFTC